jgi:hypothetical protein
MDPNPARINKTMAYLFSLYTATNASDNPKAAKTKTTMHSVMVESYPNNLEGMS